jgi:hypothetical protein
MNNTKYETGIIMHSLGFTSLKDLLLTPIAAKEGLYAFFMLSFPVSGFISCIEFFTETYIYTPALGMLVLWALTAIDIVLGISVAVLITKIGFLPSKAARAVVRLLFQTAIVMIFFQMSHAWSDVIRSWMVDSMMLLFAFTVLYSVLKNGREIGLLSKEQFEVIQWFVNFRNPFKKPDPKK